MIDRQFLTRRSIHLCRLILLTLAIYSGCEVLIELWHNEYSAARSNLAAMIMLLFFWSFEPLTNSLQKSSSSPEQR